MDNDILRAQRAYWDQTFLEPKPAVHQHTHWIDALGQQTPVMLGGAVLEIGCGRGYDTRYLLAAGCRVTCLDFAWNALRHVRVLSPAVQPVNAALPAPLPFRAQTFHHVVAGLSLHYFPWQATCAIVQEIGRVLQPGGTLIFRVNTTEDVAHGAGRGEEVEPHFYLYQGRTKRFFDEQMCRDLFDATWQLETLIPWVESRSLDPKPTWMGIARRPAA